MASKTEPLLAVFATGKEKIPDIYKKIIFFSDDSISWTNYAWKTNRK